MLLCNISGRASRASVASHGGDTDPQLRSTRTVGGTAGHEPGSSRKRITGLSYCISSCLDVRRLIPGTSQVFFNLGSLESTLTRCTTEVSRKMLMKCSRLLDMATIDQDVECNGIALMFGGNTTRCGVTWCQFMQCRLYVGFAYLCTFVHAVHRQGLRRTRKCDPQPCKVGDA